MEKKYELLVEAIAEVVALKNDKLSTMEWKVERLEKQLAEAEKKIEELKLIEEKTINETV